MPSGDPSCRRWQERQPARVLSEILVLIVVAQGASGTHHNAKERTTTHDSERCRCAQNGLTEPIARSAVPFPERSDKAEVLTAAGDSNAAVVPPAVDERSNLINRVAGRP